MPEQYFNAFVGSSSGVFKGICAIEKNDLLVKNLDSLKNATNKNPITAMSWGEDENEIVLGYGNQLVKIYNLKSRSFNCLQEKVAGDGGIVGISKYNGGVITAVESGMVRCFLREIDKDRREVLEIQTDGPLECMKRSPHNQNLIATGGKENDLKLWDINAQRLIFEAKNVRHDELEMRVPVWVTDIAFMLKTSKIAVTTRHGHVRLYDPSTSARRPVVSVKIPEQALTCIACCSKDHHVIVGSGTGQMNLVDLRSKGLVMNKYKGFTGGIKGISCSEEEPYIASVSLDRHFRIHHLTTKELLYKEYMQSKLTCVLVRPNFDLSGPKGSEYDDAEDEIIEVAPKELISHRKAIFTSNNIEPSTSSDDNEEVFQKPVVLEKRPKSTNSPRKKVKS